MKRCPACSRDYNDDSLNFCLDDGHELLFGRASGGSRSDDLDEPSTAILHDPAPPKELPTKRFDPAGEGQTVGGKRAGSRFIRKHFWIILVSTILVAASYPVYRAITGPGVLQHFQTIKLERVTSEGSVESAAISGDGKYIAYTLEESGKRSLWTKNLASDSRVQIAAPVESTSMFAGAFSPDGSYVYYTRVDDRNPKGAIYTVPVLGGESKKIVDEVSQPVSVSPDGKRIAYGRFHLSGPEDDLFVAGIDGSAETMVLNVKEPDFLMGSNVAWSPDGRSLAFGYGSLIKGGDPAEHRYDMRVAVLDLVAKSLKIVSKQGWPHLGNLAWFSDGSAIAIANQESFSKYQIWQCSVATGESRRITNDLSSYDTLSLSLTTDSRSLIAVQKDPVSQIWVAPVGDLSRARPLTTGKNVQDGRGNLSWTPDGRIIFDSTVSSDIGIWSINSDGTDARALTETTVDGQSPEVSLDGRTIVFSSTRTGFQIWRMDIDGRGSRQLTNGEGAPSFSVSPDGKWVLYNPYLGGIYKMPAEGGDAVKIVSGGGLVYPQLSPDGRLLAYFTTSGETKRPRIVVVNFDDASPVKTFEIPVSGAPPHLESLVYRGFHWSPDGKGLVYINTLGGISNLWLQPLDGGPAKQITDFKSERIYSFAYSHDGKTLAWARGSNSSDVVLITDSK